MLFLNVRQLTAVLKKCAAHMSFPMNEIPFQYLFPLISRKTDHNISESQNLARISQLKILQDYWKVIKDFGEKAKRTEVINPGID